MRRKLMRKLANPKMRRKLRRKLAKMRRKLRPKLAKKKRRKLRLKRRKLRLKLANPKKKRRKLRLMLANPKQKRRKLRLMLANPNNEKSFDVIICQRESDWDSAHSSFYRIELTTFRLFHSLISLFSSQIGISFGTPTWHSDHLIGFQKSKQGKLMNSRDQNLNCRLKTIL